MDQSESSARSINISSSRYIDKFQPQLIHANTKPLQKNSESMEMSPIFEKSNEEIGGFEKFRQTRGNFKKSSNYVPSLYVQDRLQNPRGSKIIKLIQQKNLIKRFKEKLIQQAHILPHNEQLAHFFEEQYINQSQNHHKSQFHEKFEQGSLEQFQSVQNINFGIKIPIINPTGRFYLFWQLLRLIQIMFLLWWVPFKVSFSPTEGEAMLQIEQMLLYLFVLDLIIKLNRGMIDQGQIVYDRLKILRHYLRYELYEDAIYLITLTLVIGGDPITIIFFPEMIVLTQFTFNFIKLKKTINRYGEMFAVQSTFTELVSLSQLIILIFYFAHFMACIWYYVGKMSQSSFTKSWITQQQIEESPLSYKYGYSFYWATATMVTVGYGDITPQNIYEVLCAIIMIFCASVVFAFSINAIGVIFSNIDSQKSAYKRNLLLINQYMNSNEVSLELQSRVRNYLKYYYEQQAKGNKQEMTQLMEKLSFNLKQELIEDVQIRAVTSIDFFIKNFSKPTIHEIACRMNMQQFTPREIIFQQNSVDENSIYIIQKGDVHIIDEKSGKVIQKCTKGQCFGEFEFLTTQKRQSKAVSLTFSQIYRMPRETFIDILLDHQLDFQKFCEMKDRTLFQYDIQPVRCRACNGDHQIKKCHYLSYQPNAEFLIKKELFYSNQKRSPFKRKNQRYLRVFNYDHDITNTNKPIVDPQGSIYSQGSAHEHSSQTGSENQNNNDDLASHIKKRISLWVTNPDQPQLEQQSKFIQYLESIQKSARHNSDTSTHKVNKKSVLQSSHDAKRHQSNNQLLMVSEQLQQQMSSSNNSQAKSPEKGQQQKFSQLDDLKSYHTYHCEIDKIEQFQIYFPHNNIQTILTYLQKYQKQQKLFRIHWSSSKYRFLCINKIPIHQTMRKSVINGLL